MEVFSMKFYTLDGVIAEAVKSGKVQCAWIPCLAHKPVSGLGENMFVIDRSSTEKVFREKGLGADRFVHRILVHPNGEVEGI
jgi:hypothetical protein